MAVTTFAVVTTWGTMTFDEPHWGIGSTERTRRINEAKLEGDYPLSEAEFLEAMRDQLLYYVETQS